MKTIAIPGVGDVDFPDEMTDDAISSAIRNNILPKQQAIDINDPSLGPEWSALMENPEMRAIAERSQMGRAPQQRQPTAEELARPSFDAGYQQPVHNLLNPPAPGPAEFPEMKEVPAGMQGGPNGQRVSVPPSPQFQNQSAPVAPQLASERERTLNQYAQDLPLSSEEFNVAAAKGAAGATPGIPEPTLSTREEATGGQYLGAMIPGVAAMATGAGVPAAMAAYGMEESLKRGGLDLTTNAPVHPIEMAVQGAIGGLLGTKAGQSIPGIIAGFGGLGAVQSTVAEIARQKQATGKVSLEQANNPEFLKSIAVSLIQGLLMGPMAAGHGGEPAADPLETVSRPGENTDYQTPPEPGRQPITPGMADAYAAQPEPPPKPPETSPAQAPAPAEEAALPQPIVPRERGIYEAAPTPDDMQGRQWAAGTEAQTRLREAEAAREPLAQAHDDAVQAAVEAENALRSRFPEEGVSPKYPAERDLQRALTARHQDAETALADARAKLDEANAARDEAQQAAQRAQPSPIPDIPMDRLKGRQEAIRAMQEARLPPEHIQRAIEVMDRRPEVYELGSKAVNLSPEVLRELGVGPDVSRETPALRHEEPAPKISYETVDFGEGSPLQAKFPEFQAMPYEQKAEAGKQLSNLTRRIATQVLGVTGRESEGPGFWEDYPIRPNAQLDASAPYEKAAAYADLVGYLHQQDAVFMMREHPDGQKLGVKLAFEGGRPDEAKLSRFWSELRKAAPDLAIGGMSTPEGILIARDEPSSQREPFKAKYSEAIRSALERSGLRAQADFANIDWELRQSGGWKDGNNGRAYLERLQQALGPEIGERVDRLYRPAVESAVGRIVAGKQPELAAAGRGPLLQEHDAAHGRGERNGSGELQQRYGIDPAGLEANTPEAAKSVYTALGNKIEAHNTGPELKIYPLADVPPEKLQAWLQDSGWNYKIFGPDQETGKFVPPNFREFSYDNKHVWIFSPWTEHGSFRDTEYTRIWRVTHEVAHGQTNDTLTQRYGGVGRRQGALGRATRFNGRDVPALSLADALRAVEWEHDTFQRQREILENDFGIKITEEAFRKENAINMSDAVYRVLTGDFSNPGDNGLVPRAMSPDQLLARAKDILRTQAKDLGLDMAETFSSEKPKALFQEDQPDAPAFYSQLQRAIESPKLPPKVTTDQLRGFLKAQGVKEEELRWMGFDDFLAGKDRVTKDDLKKWFDENQLQIEEVQKRHQGSPNGWGLDIAKYDNYQEPGGKNYREILLRNRKESEDFNRLNEESIRLSRAKADAMERWKRIAEERESGAPESFAAYKAYDELMRKSRAANEAVTQASRSRYNSSHWEEKGIFAHARFNDRTGPNGEKILHLEEIQSDQHQAGRKKGYEPDNARRKIDIEKELGAIEAKGKGATPEDKTRWAELMNEREPLLKGGVPDAPFRKTWHEHVLRRMLRHAAENGYDAMTWTGGEKQADRYDLSKQLSKLQVDRVAPDLYETRAFGLDGKLIHRETYEKDKLPDAIGKDLANRAVQETESGNRFETSDLKIGGEGMKGFYDKIVPDYLNKYAKKWGAKVEPIVADNGTYALGKDADGKTIEIPTSFQGIRLNEAMRRSVMKEGQSLFQDKSQGEIKGAFIPSTAEKKGMVYLVKGKADLSTVIHEYLGHGLEEKVLRAPENAALLAEAESLITKDIGQDAVKNGWTVEAKEWFARKVEQYFYEGNTDVPSLKPLFEKIRAYMQKVYAAVVGGPMGKSITADERAFFDKVFGKGEKPLMQKAKAPSEEGALAPDEGSTKKRSESISPTAPRQAPEKEPRIPGERSLPKTLEAAGIEGGTDRGYEVKHLDESAKAAMAEIDAKGAEVVQHDILGRPKFDPQDMPRAIALMRRWQHEADNLPPGEAKDTALAKTVQMASEMSRRATEAGQFNAMVRILEKLSPDGVVYYAQKQLDKLNVKRGPKREVKLKPEAAKALREAAKELKASQDLAEDAAPLAKAAEKIEKGQPLNASDLQDLAEFRRRLAAHLGERPPERPKGVLRGATSKPAAPAARGPKPTLEAAEALLAKREEAALTRLRARGLSPTKALLQSTRTLTEEDVSDLADVFASRLAARKASVSAVRQNFTESFGSDIAPFLDDIAQKGARRLQEARRERARMTDLSKRVDEILAPLLKGAPAEINQAEQLRATFDAVKDLTGDAKREASWDLQETLNAMVPSGAGKQASAVLAIAQLLNPKTALRNIVGNELFHAAERASKWVAANGIDWPRSVLTGTDRTLTFRTGGQGDYWKSLMTGTEAALRGVNPEGLESKYDLSGSSFQSKKNPFYWAERALGVTMRATDYAAYKRAFGETMGEMAEMAADRRKVQGSQRTAFIKNWIESAAPEVAEIAEAYGKYATFQDATALAKGAAGLKNFLNAGKDFGMGNFIINYPKTPANILMRAIEYSPAGILRSVGMLWKGWRTGMPVDVRELEMSLGRVLVGGMGGGLAWYLAKNGALSGQAEKDRDARDFKKEQTGESNYQVNVSAIGRWLASGLKKDQLNKRDGDKLISYDWAQPLAINAAMTATAVQALSDKRKPIEGMAATAEAGLEGATKTLEEQPLLSGLEKLFNSDKSIPGRLMDILEGVPASFSPTLLNQIRQIKDNTARSSDAPTAAGRMINKVMYRLPFLSEKLPVIYKTLGKSEPRETYQNGHNNLFNVFLNPAFVAKYHVDPGIAVILSPYEKEGRKNQFPQALTKRDLKYSQHGEQKVYSMSGEELSELQRRLAQEAYRRFESMHIERLKDASPERQEKILAHGVNDSWNKVRKEFLHEKGIHAK